MGTENEVDTANHPEHRSAGVELCVEGDADFAASESGDFGGGDVHAAG